MELDLDIMLFFINIDHFIMSFFCSLNAMELDSIIDLTFNPAHVWISLRYHNTSEQRNEITQTNAQSNRIRICKNIVRHRLYA